MEDIFNLSFGFLFLFWALDFWNLRRDSEGFWSLLLVVVTFILLVLASTYINSFFESKRKQSTRK